MDHIGGVRGPQPRDRRVGSSSAPSLMQHDIFQRLSLGPAESFESRLWRPLVGPTQAEPTETAHAIGQPDEIGQVRRLKKGDPAHTEPFNSCRQPKVLYGTRA